MADTDTGSGGNAVPHGGDLAQADVLFPQARRPWLDLSTGINPLPYPFARLPPEAFTRLPSPADLAALERAAATAYGVRDPDGVVAASGTQALIQRLPDLMGPGQGAIVIGPTYGEYARVLAAARIAVLEHAGLDGDAGLVVLANPNNPDARRHPPDGLLALAERLAARGGLLVVDEAFADFEPALSVAAEAGRPGLLVLRSFGKAYGLAGVRLGFALAEAVVAAKLRAWLGPWRVSGPAIAIGRQALADRPWLAAAGARLATLAGRLDGVLHRGEGRVVGGTALFRLLEHPDALALFQRLGRSGVYVRRFPAHARWLRFGIPAQEDALDRVREALARA